MDIISTCNETYSQYIAEVSVARIQERTVTSPPDSAATRIVSPFNNRRQSDFDFYVKLPLLVTSTACAALQSTIPISTENGYNDYLPRIIFFEFTFLNAYIILNYHWWSKLKKITKQLYGIIGCLLYLSAGVIVILNRKMSSDSADLFIAQTNMTRRNGSYRKERTGTVTSVGFLTFWEAILHFLDAVIGSY